MSKSEKIWDLSVSIAAIGIIVFWVAGFTNHLTVSAYSFFTAGIFSIIAISAKAVQYTRGDMD